MLKKIIFIVMILLMSALVLAQVPQQINYQGFLTSNTGTPITTTTPLEMTFKLYSSPIIVAHLWEATYDVDVVEGRFNVFLGKPDKWGNPKEIPFTVFDGSVKYLGIKVGADPEMAPRKEIVSVAYSYMSNDAENLDGKDDSQFVQKEEVNSVSSNMIQGSAVTAAKITPDFVSSVDGVSNDGGNIDLVAGSNISITPDDANNRITIAATAAGGDNLGNHTATQNIQLNDKYLSNDGGNEGIRVYNDGHVDAFGYLYSTSYIAAQSSMQAKDGSIRTGEPSSTYGNGDIVATSDLRADDEVIAKEGVEGEAGTGSWGVYGSKGSNYGYLGGSSAMST